MAIYKANEFTIGPRRQAEVIYIPEGIEAVPNGDDVHSVLVDPETFPTTYEYTPVAFDKVVGGPPVVAGTPIHFIQNMGTAVYFNGVPYVYTATVTTHVPDAFIVPPNDATSSSPLVFDDADDYGTTIYQAEEHAIAKGNAVVDSVYIPASTRADIMASAPYDGILRFWGDIVTTCEIRINGSPLAGHLSDPVRDTQPFGWYAPVSAGDLVRIEELSANAVYLSFIFYPNNFPL